MVSGDIMYMKLTKGEKTMTLFEEIKTKYQEFNTYLESIDLQDLRKKHSREELKKLSKELYAIEIRSLAYELSKITEEMKKEEFPQLLGVHRYPVLKEIDFLTEEEKIKLDKHLVMVRKGNYLYGLHNVTRNSEKVKMILKFLLERGVVEESYFALCPRCGSGHISAQLGKNEKEKLDIVMKDKNHSERDEVLEKYLEYVCMDCDSEPNVEHLSELFYKTVHKMMIERDKSLDNV